MRSDEFIGILSPIVAERGVETVQQAIPLGVDAAGGVAYALRERNAFLARHVCVTGGGKSKFLVRLLLTLSCLYEKGEACFFALSPNPEYQELLRMHSMDITFPYLRGKADVAQAVAALQELLRARETGRVPRLYVVVDGLDALPDLDGKEELAVEREILDLLARKKGVDVLTGVDLAKSIFSGYPAAFLGAGNCLVATRETGKADVTYAGEGGGMTMPMPITYPSAPSITETVLLFNAISKEEL